MKPSKQGKLFDKALMVIYEHLYINIYKKKRKVYNIENTLEAYLNDTKSAHEDVDKFVWLIRKAIIEAFKHCIFRFDNGKIYYDEGICINEYLYENKIYTSKYRDLRRIQIEHIIKYLSEQDLPDFVKIRNISYVDKGKHHKELVLVMP